MSWQPADSRLAFAKNRLNNLIESQKTELRHLVGLNARAENHMQKQQTRERVGQVERVLAELEQIKIDLEAS